MSIDNLKLKSKVCISPNQCYDLETKIPIWMLILLAGSTLILLKEIISNK